MPNFCSHFHYIEDPEAIEIGYWVSHCCHLDMWQIEIEADLYRAKESLRAWLTNTDGPFYFGSSDVWATKRDALLDIRESWDIGSSGYDECTKMLEELEDE